MSNQGYRVKRWHQIAGQAKPLCYHDEFFSVARSHEAFVLFHTIKDEIKAGWTNDAVEIFRVSETRLNSWPLPKALRAGV